MPWEWVRVNIYKGARSWVVLSSLRNLTTSMRWEIDLPYIHLAYPLPARPDARTGSLWSSWIRWRWVLSQIAALVTFSYFIGLLGGKVIGLPPVLNFGSEELKARIVPDVLAAKKFICLAISEGRSVLQFRCRSVLIVIELSAHAGSDVMGLQTTAVKSEDGKEWIINGTLVFPFGGKIRNKDSCIRI